MNKETVTKTNLQKRIEDLKAFIKYNQSVKEQTERIIFEIDISIISEEQYQHLEDKIYTCKELIELYEREIQDLEGLM